MRARLGSALLRLLLVMGCTLAPIGCGTMSDTVNIAEYNQAPLVVLVDSAFTADEIRRAMVQTILGRGWSVIKNNRNEVIGHLRKRGYNATVAMQRKDDLVEILIVRAERGTSAPIGWLTNLQKDLGRHVSIKGGVLRKPLIP